MSLDVPAGERVALSGTAAGTLTALLRAVTGLHPVTGGVITVGGRDTRTPAERAWRSRACAWLPSDPGVTGRTVPAATVLARSAHPAAAAQAAERLGVGRLVARPLRSLTRRQVKLLHLARVIGCVALGAGVLLADDPTAGLTAADRETLADLLAGLPVTLMVSTDDPVLTVLCGLRVDIAMPLPAQGTAPPVPCAEPPGTTNSLSFQLS
ncbi:ATP-binding cassette domain-containing protein [Streptomyces sp. NBC_00989]|uniref:ATP-binding cassette domain-containing protein n=1 Tax=Streptomyces sp. NBC_00989 TaxID=2903705 RepID=UPI0038704DB6|nr:ABC transporter ATP-binding protein [Streptomyces sp. NBC_00989]